MTALTHMNSTSLTGKARAQAHRESCSNLCNATRFAFKFRVVKDYDVLALTAFADVDIEQGLVLASSLEPSILTLNVERTSSVNRKIRFEKGKSKAACRCPRTE
jgi:hypothetical protein